MEDDEIAVLRKILMNRTKSSTDLYWQATVDSAPLRVTSIGAPPPVDLCDEPEPSDVAYLQNGTYVALWNAELTQFVTLAAVSLVSGAQESSVDLVTEALLTSIKALKSIIPCSTRFGGRQPVLAQGALDDILLTLVRDNQSVPAVIAAEFAPAN